MLLFLLFALHPISSGAATLEVVNHTGAVARVAELFNICQRYIVPPEKPILLQDGEARRFEVLLVMQHYKICGSGFCSSSSIQLKEGDEFQLEMVLTPGGIIEGIDHPDQWGGPSNACPEMSLVPAPRLSMY